MKHDFKTYAILSSIFVLSLVGAAFVDASELFKAVITAPGVAALIGALYQLARDQAAFEKQLHIQEKQFQFTLGAASHMANTAFDKHVEFCEKYMNEIHEVVHTLWREADTPEALVHANKFYKLREDYAVWLTDDINENLGKFEDAIRKLGAQAHFIRTTVGHEGYAEQRILRIDQNHNLFSEILGIEETKEVNEDYAAEVIKKKVRRILGVEELTRLRGHLISRSIEVIEST